MTNNTQSYEWHTESKRVRYAVSALLVLASIGVALHAHTTTLALVSVVFAVGALAPLIEQRVRIDPVARDVVRDIRLGRVCLWSSCRPLGDFTGIGAYRLPSGPPQACSDLVHVGLMRSTGSVLAIRYFNVRRGQPCPEADAFARSLGEMTRLKFHGVA